jgi:hypothetical protein
VKKPPYENKQQITTGSIYRRIPNLPGFFDHEKNCAMLLSFRASDRDRKAGGMSALLTDYVSPEEARTNPHNPEDRTFGLCRLDIATILDATKGAVTVTYNPRSTPLGHAHVQIRGCDDSEELQQLLAVLATVIRAPGPDPA